MNKVSHLSHKYDVLSQIDGNFHLISFSCSFSFPDKTCSVRVQLSKIDVGLPLTPLRAAEETFKFFYFLFEFFEFFIIIYIFLLPIFCECAAQQNRPLTPLGAAEETWNFFQRRHGLKSNLLYLYNKQEAQWNHLCSSLRLSAPKEVPYSQRYSQNEVLYLLTSSEAFLKFAVKILMTLSYLARNSGIGKNSFQSVAASHKILLKHFCLLTQT